MNCRQVEILRLSATNAFLDLAVLEHYENLKEAKKNLRFSSGLQAPRPMLKRYKNLCRITLDIGTKLPLPSSEKLCDFIMELNRLTYMHIIYRDDPQ